MIGRILTVSARRPGWALAIALLLAALAGLSASRLRPDTSIESFFSPGQPSVVALSRVLEHFPTAEEMLVMVSVKGEQPDPDALLAYAASFEKAIRSDAKTSAMVAGVRYRASPEVLRFFTEVGIPNAVDYLDDAEFSAALDRLTLPHMREQLTQDQALLAAPGPAAGALAKVFLQDPLHLHEFIEARLAAARPMKTWHNSDAFLSPDGRSLLIRIAGTTPPSDLRFCGQISAAIAKIARDVNGGKLDLDISGAYPIAAQSEHSIRADSIDSVNGSVICLALLFVLAFRRGIGLFLVTFLPVALGVLYGFGVYALVSKSVTPLTAVVGAVLGGIGIDYAIFYVVHYQERRLAGDTIGRIGSALFAAWVTSVVGFIAVGFTSVRALRDFAIVGSLGLGGALLGAVFVLPALLVLADRWHARRALMAAARPAGPSRVRLTMAGPRFSPLPMMQWIDRRAGVCAVAGTAVMAFLLAWLILAAPRLQLESDATVMHPRPNAPLDAEAHIAARMEMSPDAFMVHLRAASPDQLLSLAHRVDRALATPAARQAGVKSTIGLATLLPDPAVAARRQATLAATDAGMDAGAPGNRPTTGEVDPPLTRRVLGDFDAAVADSPFSANGFAKFRDFLQRLLKPSTPPSIVELIRYPELAQMVLPHEALAKKPATEAVTFVSLTQAAGGPTTVAQRRAQVDALRDILKNIPGATLTGMAVLGEDTRSTIEHDMPRLILVAVVLCAVYLLLHFRSIVDTALAVLPTVCSLSCLLAVAVVLGAKMNLANIVSVPLLIGIDIDYGIFVVSVSRRCRSRDDLRQTVAASGLAVMLCASATLLGFGSLAFTSVPAVRSLGWAVAIGVSTCAVASLFYLLPLLLWLRGRKDRRIAPG